jgi:hypothetical protein
LEHSVALSIDPKANHRQLARKGLLKLLAITGLDVKNTFLIDRRMPPMSYLMRYYDFLLHRGDDHRFTL